MFWYNSQIKWCLFENRKLTFTFNFSWNLCIYFSFYFLCQGVRLGNIILLKCSWKITRIIGNIIPVFTSLNVHFPYWRQSPFTCCSKGVKPDSEPFKTCSLSSLEYVRFDFYKSLKLFLHLRCKTPFLKVL